MHKLIIITNNPLVIKKYKSSEHKIINCDKIEDIFKSVRDLIHKGYILISHPLAGSVKPYLNPYRSILLKKSKKLDYKSLETYQNSYQKYQQFKENKKNRKDLSDEILKDYQVIDLSLIESAL